MIINGSPLTIRTERIFREAELDKGFIMRANDAVAKNMREMIHMNQKEDNDKRTLEIFCILPERRTYGYDYQ